MWTDLMPIAASRFSTELDQVGRRELVHGDCALHHFYINSFSLELEFKPEPPILSDQAPNLLSQNLQNGGSCR